MKNENVFWLYKEYSHSKRAFAEDIARLFPTEEKAKAFLLKRVKESYGMTLEEMRKNPDFQGDKLYDNYVTITNDCFDVDYYSIEKIRLEDERDEDKKETTE